MLEYRGKIPFLLNEMEEKVFYLCSSNRNIEDYYNVLMDIYDGKLLKLEANLSYEELEKDNYDLLEILKSKKKCIILFSLEAVFREYFSEGKRYELKIGENINIKTLEKELEKSGYQRGYMVEQRNQYSIRGDILDIFPKNGNFPIRVEFNFGDEIERITYFDIETQKSIEKKEVLYMYINNNNKEKNTFLEFLKTQRNIKIYVENTELLNYKFTELVEERMENKESLEKNYKELMRLAERVELRKFESSELKKFEDLQYVKTLGAAGSLLDVKIVSEEEKRYREIFENCNFEFEKYPLYEGYREGKYKKEIILFTKIMEWVYI